MPRRKIKEAKTKHLITRELIAGIVFTGERQDYRDTKLPGFMLRVGAKRGMSYAYDYRINGQRKKYTFDEDPTRVDPAKIREKIRTLGIDPAGEKRERRVASQTTERCPTVREFLEGDYFKRKLAAQSSGSTTKQRIQHCWGPFLNVALDELDPVALHAHRMERMSEEEIKPQSLNVERMNLLTMMNKAVEWRVISRNPLIDPAFKALKPEDDKRVRWLGQRDEHEEIVDDYGVKVGERERFMEALQHPETPEYLRDMALLALNTGMRRGEIFKLSWFDVSFQREQLTVRATNTKTKKARHLDLNESALAVLKRRAKHKSSELVFPSPKDGEMFLKVERSWASLLVRARIEDFHFHDQRHDFASRLVQKGVDLYKVKELLGHSSIKMTERYAHLAPKQLREAVRLLDAEPTARPVAVAG